MSEDYEKGLIAEAKRLGIEPEELHRQMRAAAAERLGGEMHITPVDQMTERERLINASRKAWDAGDKKYARWLMPGLWPPAEDDSDS